MLAKKNTFAISVLVILLYSYVLFPSSTLAQDITSSSSISTSSRMFTLIGEQPDTPPPPELIKKLQTEANYGHKDSQYFLGLLYYYGQGVIKDETVAMRLFREAALQGHPQAAANLGIMLESGSNTNHHDPHFFSSAKRDPDLSGAFAWYSAAAAAGEPHAMFHAGLMLYENRVPNYNEYERIADAFSYFEKANQLHYPDSYYYLGLLYEYGAHKSQNFIKAMELYTEGCTNSRIKDADCCFNLGLLYAYGRGIEQNYIEAINIFLSCYNNYHHAGCTLYLGLMYAAGQGTNVDYEAAQVYLQQAAESTDIRFREQAHTAYYNLHELITKAEKEISHTLDEISQGIAKKPKEYHDMQTTGSRRNSEAFESSSIKNMNNVQTTNYNEEEEEL